jgi:hypothetical protein
MSMQELKCGNTPFFQNGIQGNDATAPQIWKRKDRPKVSYVIILSNQNCSDHSGMENHNTLVDITSSTSLETIKRNLIQRVHLGNANKKKLLVYLSVPKKSRVTQT